MASRNFKAGTTVKLELGGHHRGPYKVTAAEAVGDGRQRVSIQRGSRGYVVYGEWLKRARKGK